MIRRIAAWLGMSEMVFLGFTACAFFSIGLGAFLVALADTLFMEEWTSLLFASLLAVYLTGSFGTPEPKRKRKCPSF